GAVGPRPGAAAQRGRNEAPGRAPRRLGLERVPAALELRRPLAQARAAVRALGDVRAYLGAAVLADDPELGLAHCRCLALTWSRITARPRPAHGAAPMA